LWPKTSEFGAFSGQTKETSWPAQPGADGSKMLNAPQAIAELEAATGLSLRGALTSEVNP
jgi:hypothetical protein